MNRLDTLFKKKNQNLLSVYFTAGYPNLNDTGEIIAQLSAHGVDMIEVGVPFSDPMADGVVIQQSGNRAIENGMTLSLLLNQVEQARTVVPDTPLVLMSYLNPLMRYGIERLFASCSKAGIDALIIPDLPFDDYLNDFKPLCDKYNLPIIMLITPETSADRIALIDRHCSGFIYMVSAASTTGTKDHFTPAQIDYFRRIASMPLQHHRLIGFGISNPATFDTACQYSSGAITGSMFIKCLTQSPYDIATAVKMLLNNIGRQPLQ